MKTTPLILLGVMLNATAQLMLKQGMVRIGSISYALSEIWTTGLNLARSPFVIGGMMCYVVSVFVWLLVLSRVEVSYAYPMVSLGYIVTAVAAFFFMNEALTPSRILGICVIMMGVYLISRA